MEKSLNQTRPSKDREAERIAAAQEDPRKFGALYDQYAPAIYRYLLSRLGNVEAAQDVTSQTFLTAIKKLPTYQHRGHFSAWLFSIARSKYVDYLRKAKHTTDPVGDEHPDPCPSPLNDLVTQERRAALLACIQSLTFQEQELLRLRYVADLSFAEMATLLSKREDAVKKRFYRLLSRLRNQLED